MIITFCRVVKVTAFMLLAVGNLRSWQPRFAFVLLDSTVSLKFYNYFYCSLQLYSNNLLS